MSRTVIALLGLVVGAVLAFTPVVPDVEISAELVLKRLSGDRSTVPVAT